MKQQKARTAAVQPDLTAPEGEETARNRPDAAGNAPEGDGSATQPDQTTETQDAEPGTETDAAQPDPETLARERFAAEAEELHALCPAFDAQEFLRESAAGEGGRPEGALWRAALPWILAREREEARRQAIEAVRARMGRAPEPLRAAGAAGSPAADYSGMTSQQFARVRQGVEEQLRLGKRVKL